MPTSSRRAQSGAAAIASTSSRFTSGTIFASRKLPIVTYLLAIAIFVNGAKGHSALQMSRDLDCQHKSAYVMCHKLREAMAVETANTELDGEVEVDGAYFGGHVRPANRKEDRIDRRLAENQTGKRRVVVVARQRGGKTLTFVVKREGLGVAASNQRVAPESVVYADEAAGWDVLHTRLTKRIDHSKAYCADGACTNQAESFFSRLRRAEIGTHHHFAGRYLYCYAGEMAWRENNSRVSNGAQYLKVTEAAPNSPVSRQWKGYWQRNQSL